MWLLWGGLTVALLALWWGVNRILDWILNR